MTYYRSLGYLGIGKETTPLTGVSPTKFLKQLSSSFMPKPTVNDYNSGNVLDIGFSLKEKFHYAGDIVCFPYADEAAFLFALAMGADSVSGAGPYTHAITLTNGLPSFSAEASFFEDQILDRVLGCKVNRLLLEAKAGEKAKLTLGIIGSSVGFQSSASTPSFSDSAGEGPMMMSQAAITLTGPTSASTLQGQIDMISFEINRNLGIQHGPGVLTPIYLTERRRMIKIKMRAIFNAADVYRLTHYGSNTGTAPIATMGTGSAVIKFTAQASPERSLQLTCANMTFQDAKPMYDPEAETAMLDLECIGFRSGATLPLVVSAINNVSAGYLA